MSEVAPAQGPIAKEAWYADLRARFLEVARRRVEESAIEDVVQDALKVIHAKSSESSGPAPEDPPPLAWAFQVLRNTIGTHYRNTRTRRARVEFRGEFPTATDSAPGPAEAFESSEVVAIVQQTLDDMATQGDRCAQYLRSLARGLKPGALAAREEVTEAVLYRRIYRCRQKLREALHARGVEI